MADGRSEWAARVTRAFEANFAGGLEVGASLSVWRDGRSALSLAGGHRDEGGGIPWTSATRVLCWSATKVPAAVAVLTALHDRGMAPEQAVASLWPEFGANGKGGISVLDVLSHRAGLAGLAGERLDPFDHAAVADALARARPLWRPGDGHGYHARTFGYLADEIVRRLTGSPLGRFWRERIAGPAGLDFHIGLPPDEADGVADSLAPRRFDPPAAESAFYEALRDPDSLSALAFRSPGGDIRTSRMNTRKARVHGFPALGGIGTAEALARFYSLLLGQGRGAPGDRIPRVVRRAVGTPLSGGVDRVLRIRTRFGAGAMLNPLDDGGRIADPLFGPSSVAFGHPGAGGCLAFADPEHGIALAYVMNRMSVGVLPDRRARSIVHAVYGTA